MMRGYYAFVSHMDGNTRKIWRVLNNLWHEVNFGDDEQIHYQLGALIDEVYQIQVEDLKHLFNSRRIGREKDLFNMFQNIIEKIEQIRSGQEVYTNPKRGQ